MRLNSKLKAILVNSGFAASAMLMAGAANAQVTLNAQATITTLPDGQAVPMWGLACVQPATPPAAGAPTLGLVSADLAAAAAAAGSFGVVAVSSSNLNSPVCAGSRSVGRCGAGMPPRSKLVTP